MSHRPKRRPTNRHPLGGRPSAGKFNHPICRQCGELTSVAGIPVAGQAQLCDDCRNDLAAGGPDGETVESLIDGMDD